MFTTEVFRGIFGKNSKISPHCRNPQPFSPANLVASVGFRGSLPLDAGRWCLGRNPASRQIWGIRTCVFLVVFSSRFRRA
jgi:hypothetical protein